MVKININDTRALETVTIDYSASVFVPAGWRSVNITARAEKISPKRVVVLEVIAIDGESPIGYQSRTGAKRQAYHAEGIAKREIGKIKNIASLTSISE